MSVIVTDSVSNLGEYLLAPRGTWYCIAEATHSHSRVYHSRVYSAYGTVTERVYTESTDTSAVSYIRYLTQRVSYQHTAEIQSMSAVHSSGILVRCIITLSISYPKWISYDSHSLNIKDILHTSWDISISCTSPISHMYLSPTFLPMYFGRIWLGSLITI